MAASFMVMWKSSLPACRWAVYARRHEPLTPAHRDGGTVVVPDEAHTVVGVGKQRQDGAGNCRCQRHFLHGPVRARFMKGNPDSRWLAPSEADVGEQEQVRRKDGKAHGIKGARTGLEFHLVFILLVGGSGRRRRCGIPLHLAVVGSCRAVLVNLSRADSNVVVPLLKL